jgi:hypothetical protein
MANGAAAARRPAPLALLVLTAALTGCSTTIIQPEIIHEPREVFIIDHGHTSSLVIPASDGLLRYAYGDWAYYALRKNDIWHGIAALLWPTQGALGRGALTGPQTAPNIRQQVGNIGALHTVRVEHARVTAFRRRMEELFRSRADTEVENVPYGMRFVYHPRSYTYWWNSNHAVASWLRELGCETRGLSFHAAWRVR